MLGGMLVQFPKFLRATQMTDFVDATLGSHSQPVGVARLAGAAAGLLLLQACATDQPPKPTVSKGPAVVTEEFRTSDFTWSQAPGKGRIEGQLTFRGGGKPYGCAGTGVVLTPETPWTRRRMTILYASPRRAALPATEVRGRTPPGRSADYSAFVKRAACDASGRFAFSGLPDGAWYAITVAKPSPPGAGADMAIMRRVEIRGGKTVELSL